MCPSETEFNSKWKTIFNKKWHGLPCFCHRKWSSRDDLAIYQRDSCFGWEVGLEFTLRFYDSVQWLTSIFGLFILFIQWWQISGLSKPYNLVSLSSFLSHGSCHTSNLCSHTFLLLDWTLSNNLFLSEEMDCKGHITPFAWIMKG